MDRLRFGTAGVPISSEERSTIGGIKEVRKLGLDAMEMEFVRGVRMKEDMARKAGEIAKSLDIVLTAHGPYYINLLSDDRGKVEASIKRILDTARITSYAGGYSITFHAAYYGKISREEAYKLVKERMKRVIDTLQDENISIWVRPETTGKGTQFGTIDEIIMLSQELDMVLPCVDFAHLHARSNGKYNSYEEFSQILEKIEKNLGREALENMHIHFSGIEYSEKGERRHLNLEESDMNYRELLRAWRDFKIKGVAISESPNIEGDAILMKKLWGEI